MPRVLTPGNYWPLAPIPTDRRKFSRSPADPVLTRRGPGPREAGPAPTVLVFPHGNCHTRAARAAPPRDRARKLQNWTTQFTQISKIKVLKPRPAGTLEGAAEDPRDRSSASSDPTRTSPQDAHRRHRAPESTGAGGGALSEALRPLCGRAGNRSSSPGFGLEAEAPSPTLPAAPPTTTFPHLGSSSCSLKSKFCKYEE